MTQTSDATGYVFRALSLEWYRTASSPRGARENGGRFNRPGKTALYVALEADTALREYHRTDLPRPCVVVAWQIDGVGLFDLRNAELAGDWRNWQCDWEQARIAHFAGDKTADCESWRCGDQVIAARRPGIIYPSRHRAGGNNLVLFTEDATAGSLQLTLIDPNRDIARANPPR